MAETLRGGAFVPARLHQAFEHPYLQITQGAQPRLGRALSLDGGKAVGQAADHDTEGIRQGASLGQQAGRGDGHRLARDQARGQDGRGLDQLLQGPHQESAQAIGQDDPDPGDDQDEGEQPQDDLLQFVNQRGRAELDHQARAGGWSRQGEDHAVAPLSPQHQARGLPIVRQENHQVIGGGAFDAPAGPVGQGRILVPRWRHADLEAGVREQSSPIETGHLPRLGEDIGPIRMPPRRVCTEFMNHEGAENPQAISQFPLQAFLQIPVLPSDNQDRGQQKTGKQEAIKELPHRETARATQEGGHRHKDESRQGGVQDAVQGLLDRDQQGLLPDHPHGQTIQQQNQWNADQEPKEGDGETQSR